MRSLRSQTAAGLATLAPPEARPNIGIRGRSLRSRPNGHEPETRGIAGFCYVPREMRGDMREMRASMKCSTPGWTRSSRLGKVDQRLLTIERVVLPSTTPDE